MEKVAHSLVYSRHNPGNPMDSQNTHRHQALEPAASKAREPVTLACIPVSEYLRNIANQTVIHSQRADIVREIRANPGDDTPRLRYAEHLERHPLTIRDKARAELIRLQIARGEEAPTERERQILLNYEREWIRELGHVRGVTWDRGFITGVSMSPRHFAQSQEAMFREPIKNLHIHTVGGSEEGGADLQAAVRAPHFALIEKLSFWIASPSSLAPVEDLLGSHGAKLREIHFQRFCGSHQELLETCQKLHYPTPDPLTSNALALGDIAVTFGLMK